MVRLVLSETSYRECIHKFENGDFNVERKERSGRAHAELIA